MDVVDIADARRARRRADDERQRADDERRMRRALKDADKRIDYKAKDRQRLGALAVIFETLVEAAHVDRSQRSDRPKSDKSYWVDHTHEWEERIEAAKQQLIDLGEINQEGGDVRILFRISASTADVENGEAVLRVAHRAICGVPKENSEVPKESLREWHILTMLAGGKSPKATAKAFKIKSDRQVSRIKLRALGKILIKVRHLLPPARANLPKKAAA